MIILDKVLEEYELSGRYVRVGIVGAGYIGRGITLQILRAFPALQVVAISNRTVEKAKRIFREGGREDYGYAASSKDFAAIAARGHHVITEDPTLLCETGEIDVIIEATGDVEHGAMVALTAIRNGKHVVMMNTETDATLGPILAHHARASGVVYTNADGDQPAVVMNLLRFVRAIGYQPVLAGNIKGMLDHYRTPDTQREFAQRHQQDVKHITSFADGTKLAFEQVVIANATGFPVGRRGMYGPACQHVDEAVNLFPRHEMLSGGLTDYVLGANPGPGVFVLGYNEDPIFRQYMPVFKMGEGPFYVFYTPYHLPHLEAPLTVARAVLFKDAAIAPKGPPVCETIAVAKRNLQAGETIDGIGGFMCYGTIDNTAACRAEDLLPMGLAEGCTLRRTVQRDSCLTFQDVALPGGRLIDKLWHEQYAIHNHDM